MELATLEPVSESDEFEEEEEEKAYHISTPLSHDT